MIRLIFLGFLFVGSVSRAASTRSYLRKDQAPAVMRVTFNERLIYSQDCGENLSGATCRAVVAWRSLDARRVSRESIDDRNRLRGSAYCEASGGRVETLLNTDLGADRAFCVFDDASMVALESLYLKANP